ncbi:general substrate transporter [Calocera viscosa TUFC12733]|uniref:General substrate transporter n=1 Tax=Calocera viscosa (strain TUFC12733) TaxID=1330018 RepID=A0A167H9D2_CALVF|nr:general substrate transporter [Calocera viscosa TUFC12733]
MANLDTSDKVFYDEHKVDADSTEKSLDGQESPVHNEHADMTETERLKVRNARFATAVRNSPIKQWSKESVHLYFACFVSFLCACANGYDGSLFSGLSPMPYYQSFFQSGTVGNKVSLIFSMYTVGSMIGAFSAGPIADRFGRRVGMFVGGVVIITGMALTASAPSINQLVGGRFVLGWGISIMTVAAPAYCVEIAPPHWRGKMVGTYNCGWFGGSIPAAAITFGCLYINSDWSWRIPMIFQGVPSMFVLVGVWFIPESPRWLMQNNRQEEARAFLVKYHGNNDTNSEIVHLEWAEFTENIQFNASDKRWWDYRALFATNNARYRFLMVMLISVFGQFSGNGLGYFNNVIYANLGYTSPAIQLGLNLAGSCGSAVIGLTAASFTDRLPRVRTLAIGTLVCAILLAINAGCNTVWANTPTDANGNAIDPPIRIAQLGLAAYFLFGFVYTFAYTPLQGVYPTENLENTARAKGLALSGVLVNLIGFINTYAGPIALQNIKNNYTYVFVGWDIIEAIIWALCGVETQGRTLEELDEIYNQKYPPFASRRYSAEVAVLKDGHAEIVRDI